MMPVLPSAPSLHFSLVEGGSEGLRLGKTMLFPLIILMMMLIVYDSDHFDNIVNDGDLVGDEKIFFFNYGCILTNTTITATSLILRYKLT